MVKSWLGVLIFDDKAVRNTPRHHFESVSHAREWQGGIANVSNIFMREMRRKRKKEVLAPKRSPKRKYYVRDYLDRQRDLNISWKLCVHFIMWAYSYLLGTISLGSLGDTLFSLGFHGRAHRTMVNVRFTSSRFTPQTVCDNRRRSPTSFIPPVNVGVATDDRRSVVNSSFPACLDAFAVDRIGHMLGIEKMSNVTSDFSVTGDVNRGRG